MKRIIICFLFIFILVDVYSTDYVDTEYICPFCKNEFVYLGLASFSTAGARQNLDFRMVGNGINPLFVPQCPNCNFVFYNRSFTENEIIILKNELKIYNLFEKEPNMPKNYYLAREMEIVNKSIGDIVWYLLSGIWENKDIEKNTLLINITIDYINKINETDKTYNDYQLVKLDLLRRSGKFDEALHLIEIIKLNSEFYIDYIVKIIDLQIELINNKNQEEHQLPD
jgi:uncharacterized protein (DUF2225 family)